MSCKIWLSKSIRLAVAACFLSAPVSAFAQEATGKAEAADKSADKQQDGEGAKEDDEDAEAKDPYAVPEDASVEELFNHIQSVMRSPPKTLEELKAKYGAVVKTADCIIEKTGEDGEDYVKAIENKFNALSGLSRYDRSRIEQVDELAEKLSADERPELAVLGESHALSNATATLGRDSTEEDAGELAARVLKFLDRFGMTKQTYGAASSVARSIGYSEHTEVGAGLYEKLSEYMEKSEDEALVERAASMLGAARRMRLPGNPIEVFGQTPDGNDFAWDDYKGKVVLVDFWASWCGPCIGELPNMKKNLKLYGERGFEIVGINMDSKLSAFEKCIEEKGITWTNIISNDEDAMGWQAPMATHYGITGIPTAILVNQEGNVVSLRARGSELDKLLEELLGPAEETADDSQPPVEDKEEVADDKN